MRRHLTGRCALGLAATTAAVAASTLGAGTANALPAQTGDACPAAFMQVSVDAFGEPYTFPAALDEFGNGNGIICVFPLPDAYATRTAPPAARWPASSRRSACRSTASSTTAPSQGTDKMQAIFPSTGRHSRSPTGRRASGNVPGQLSLRTTGGSATRAAGPHVVHRHDLGRA